MSINSNGSGKTKPTEKTQVFNRSPQNSESAIEGCRSELSSRSIDCVGAVPKKAKKRVLNIKDQLNNAKSILQQCSSISGDNTFDHLAELIRRIIDQRPANVIDYFEEFSRNVREQKFRSIENFIESVYEGPKNLWNAECILQSLNLTDELQMTDEEEASIKNLLNPKPIAISDSILELHHYWSLCGFGMDLDETFQLSCAVQKLIVNPKIESVRFWGKMFALHKTYYIVECDLTKAEVIGRKQIMKERLKQMQNEFVAKQANGSRFLGDPSLFSELTPGKNWTHYCNPTELEIIRKVAVKKLAPIPMSAFNECFETPPELVGHGLNRKVYFVITSLTDNWIELPVVTPKQICVSKKIKKFLTGDLEQQIVSYPDFPGLEKHYLRALIARITASTYIAPKYYYLIEKNKDSTYQEQDEENEEEEEEGEEIKKRDLDLLKNENFSAPPICDLLNPCAWVHIRPSILPQGRVEFVDVEDYLEQMNDEEEEDGDEEQEHEKEVEKVRHSKKLIETGPPILTSVEEDVTVESTSPWSMRYSSVHNRVNQIVYARSNIWPGAYSFAHANIIDSIYFGSGQQYISRNFTPSYLPEIQSECPFNNIEKIDPTPKAEEEWRRAHLAHKKKDDLKVADLKVDDESDEEEELESY